MRVLIIETTKATEHGSHSLHKRSCATTWEDCVSNAQLQVCGHIVHRSTETIQRRAACACGHNLHNNKESFTESILLYDDGMRLIKLQHRVMNKGEAAVSEI